MGEYNTPPPPLPGCQPRVMYQIIFNLLKIRVFYFTHVLCSQLYLSLLLKDYLETEGKSQDLLKIINHCSFMKMGKSNFD